MCSKPIFCSKIALKGKTCSRLLKPQKVAPNAKSCSKVAEHNRDTPTRGLRVCLLHTAVSRSGLVSGRCVTMRCIVTDRPLTHTQLFNRNQSFLFQRLPHPFRWTRVTEALETRFRRTWLKPGERGGGKCACSLDLFNVLFGDFLCVVSFSCISKIQKRESLRY